MIFPTSDSLLHSLDVPVVSSTFIFFITFKNIYHLPPSPSSLSRFFILHSVCLLFSLYQNFSIFSPSAFFFPLSFLRLYFLSVFVFLHIQNQLSFSFTLSSQFIFFICFSHTLLSFLEINNSCSLPFSFILLPSSFPRTF